MCTFHDAASLAILALACGGVAGDGGEAALTCSRFGGVDEEQDPPGLTARQRVAT